MACRATARSCTPSRCVACEGRAGKGLGQSCSSSMCVCVWGNGGKGATAGRQSNRKGNRPPAESEVGVGVGEGEGTWGWCGAAG